MVHTDISFLIWLNTFVLVLRNIHYAKSIRILNTLTDGTNYIRPPVIFIEYGELSLTNIGKEMIVDVRKRERESWLMIGFFF